MFQYPTAPVPGAPGTLRTSVRATAVLRFTSGDVVLDLEEWPADWMQLTNEQLVELARRANPPRI